MTRNLGIALTTLLVMLTTGCGNLLFYDDFESDTVGSPPDLIPPGDPVGDLIYMSTTSGSTLRVITGPTSGGKWVSYRKSEDANYLRYAGFISKEITPGERAFTVSWNGRANLSSADGPLEIWVGSAHFAPICGFRIEDGRMLWQTGGDHSDAGAFTNGGVHTVIWTIDRNANTCSIGINGGGVNISLGSQPVTGTGLSNIDTARPSLWLWFSEGGVGASTYDLNDIRIAETDRE
jgi:hypothetical protein